MATEPVRAKGSVRFGDDFELDLRAYELRRGGRALKLERIPMDLLVFLIEQRGELVTRDQIIEKIWGKDVFLDTDGSINSAIRKIRQVLKDDPDQPRFVQTVSGKGYRFIAPIEEVGVPAPLTAPQPTLAENLLGKKVSHYRVLEMLGGGGMGVVYKAEDLKLGRLVALKFLPGEVAKDSVAFARLEQEARAASSLDHPNICSIYQLGEHDGQPFIVMQFMEGQTLRDWIETHSAQDPGTRVKKLAELAIQIASGLEAAHERGIIHRDIKPANIFITNRGQAKILDFGVAKFIDAADFPDAKNTEVDNGGKAPPADPRLTRTGAAVGTPSYLSPEQVRHQKLDERTDLFSFGLVLYEMAIGQRAFSGNTAAEIRDAVLTLPAVPLREMDPDLPPELERIVAKSLEKNPEQRYQSAAELLVDLQGLKARLHPIHASKAYIRVLVAAGAMLVLLTPFAFNLGGIRERLFRRAAPADSSAVLKARPSIAVLGFKNLSGRNDEDWISTALSEMLDAELASGQQLRVVSGENVARMKLDLSLPVADTYAQDTLSRIKDHLNADVVVHGSYLALGKDSGGRVRINLQLQDTRAGETIAVVSRDGTEADLANLVTQSGASLRQKLGISDIAAGDADQVRSAIPSNPEAAALYAEGLAKLRNFDVMAARDLLVKATASDPNHALSYAALSEAWSQLGYDRQAKEDAKKAVDRSAKLSRENQLWVEGRYREAMHDWPRAVDVYRMLWGFFPDNVDYGLRLARVQASAGMGKEALVTVETLAKRPPPAGSDPRIDLAEATVADRFGDLRREEAAAARAADKGQRQGARILRARALLTRGSALSALGDNANAVADLKEAQTVFAEVGDQAGVARVLNNLGIIARHQSNVAEARKFLEESLDISRRTGNKLGMAQALNNLGNVLSDQGDIEGTLLIHNQSLKLAREIGDRSREATSLNNIAGLLTMQGKLSEARQTYNESLRVAREVDDQESIGVALGNIGDLLTRQGELTEARKTLEEAVALDRQVGDKSFEAYALHQLGTVLALQSDVAGGRKRYQEALSVRHELGEKVTEAETQYALAELQLDEGDARAAESELSKIIPIFHDAGSTDDEALSNSMLGLTLLAQGKTAEAQQATAKSNKLLPKTQDLITRLQVEIANAYVAGSASKMADASRVLETTRERAGRQGYVGLVFLARLRLGEIELRTDKGSAGKARLEQLQKEAQAKGFLLIARKAKAALNNGAISRAQ